MPIGVRPGEVSLDKTVLIQGPVGPQAVEIVDTAVRYAISLTNPGGDVLVAAETAPGTYTVHRIRAGTDTEIVAATAATESAGVISATIDFSGGNWQDGDQGYIEFSGITATLNDATTSLPNLRADFRVAEASSRGGRFTYPSIAQAQVTLTSSQQNITLPSVTIPALPSGVTIARVIAAVQWRKQVDSSGLANAIAGTTQQIQVRSDAPGTFTNAITIPDNSLSTGATATEGGPQLLGEADISGEVDEADTYEFQWLNAQVDGDNLVLHDFQTILLVEFI